jgi:hypothetical protein
MKVGDKVIIQRISREENSELHWSYLVTDPGNLWDKSAIVISMHNNGSDIRPDTKISLKVIDSGKSTRWPYSKLKVVFSTNLSPSADMV